MLQVKKIEGVFSGTMSYIFNEFSTGNPDGPAFSSVVSVARDKGYTVRLWYTHPGPSILIASRNPILRMTSTAMMLPESLPSCLVSSPTSLTPTFRPSNPSCLFRQPHSSLPLLKVLPRETSSSNDFRNSMPSLLN